MQNPRKPANEASVLSRVGTILGMFSEDRPTLLPSDVETALAVSPATAYRYLADLCDIGMLSRVSGRYGPGPKILELEFLMTNFDPLLVAAKGIVDAFSRSTGCHVLLSRMYGESIVNVLYSKGRELPDLNFVVGRKLPLFRGSQSRIILSALDRRKLRRIFDQNAGQRDRDRIGADWPSFSAALLKTRQDGYYVSRQELDPEITGIAAPVFDEVGEVSGSLVLAFPSATPPWPREKAIAEIVVETAQDITRRFAELAGTAAANGMAEHSG